MTGLQHSNFVHLHIHTEYSLLDGACRIDSLVKTAREYNMPALAITDHGNLFGAIDFYYKVSRGGIKPIIGSEVYIAPRSLKERTVASGKYEGETHLILLARNEEGYRNLMKLSTISFCDGFYYRPRIDKEVLSQHSKGLLAMTACVRGEVQQLILKDRINEAKETASFYKDLFGAENFYLEIQDHALPEEAKIIKGMLSLSKEMEIPLVATNDCHYLVQDDAKAHSVLLCIQTNTTLDDPERFKFTTDQIYFKSPKEMTEIFKEIPESISNTLEVAEKCNLLLELDTGRMHLPHFQLPEGETSLKAYLEKQARIGLSKRYSKVTPEIEKRLEHELSIIEKMGYAGYFLIVKDIVSAAREAGIPVGPGRGSAVGSLVLYALGVTDVDPLEYGLFFERFLHPERLDPPDIDIDFGDEKRHEVIEYVKNKYGKDNVSPIITFGTMQARAAVRDVGRVLGLPYSEVDRLAKLIPFNETLSEAIKIPELKKEIESRKEIAELFDIARRLEGLTRHASTHAAGIVITPGPLTDNIPLYRTTNGEVTTQYEMKCLSRLGALKMDFLGLRTLTVIEKTKKMLEEQGIYIDFHTIPFDDKKTYDLLKKASTIGIFQLESPGMRDVIRRLHPNSISDIIALISLYRPGPMGMIDDFIERRDGKRQITYDHPVLESVLKETYGIGIYQEQVMEMASRLAGFTAGEVDLLRWAMSKKKMNVMEDLKEKFIHQAKKGGIKEKLAEKIFNQIAQFAGYGFNKSHSAGYATLSYQTAYLKAHYPLEFMAANLTSEMGNSNRIVILINECNSLGISVLHPDINESDYDFKVTENSIRFGLGAIKNVGKGAIDSIIEARKKIGKFKNLIDLLKNVDSRLVNKKVLESLAKAGALDSLGEERLVIFANLDETFESGPSKKLVLSQPSLFEDESISDSNKGRGQATESRSIPSTHEILKGEKEILGFYLSGHPLERYRDDLNALTGFSISHLEEAPDNSQVTIGGIISSLKRHRDRKGKPMVFLKLEDFEGSIEVTVFSDLYESNRQLFTNDSMILIRGRISTKEGEKPKLLAYDVYPLEEARANLITKVHLSPTVDLDEKIIESLKKVLSLHPGKASVFFHLNGDNKIPVTIHAKSVRVNPTDELLCQIRLILGEDSVKLEGEWTIPPANARSYSYEKAI